MLLVFFCVCICGYQKYMWYWPPTLKCPALGKRSRQRYCVQTLSSSSSLIADDSQDLPMNARVLCVYTCVTYLSVLITSLPKKKKDVDFQINLNSVLLLLTNSAFLWWNECIQYVRYTVNMCRGRHKCTYTKKKRVQTWSVLGTTQMSPCLCRSGDVITVIYIKRSDY